MAKKKATGGKFSFQELAKKMETINPEGLIASQNSERIQITNWIDTGNYLLNAQISGSICRGIPEGRVTMLSGLPGCLHPKQKVKVYISKQESKKEIELLE